VIVGTMRKLLITLNAMVENNINIATPEHSVQDRRCARLLPP
jgi:hypothetical protein